MSNPAEAAVHVRSATQTVQVMSRLARRHPELRPALRAAAHGLRLAILELQDALQPRLPPRALALAPQPRTDPKMGHEQGTLAKALLLEIILRAASDWVLYRAHVRPMYKDWADDAYVWLFKEAPSHPNWVERKYSGKMLTSFISICEVLDFDPELVRAHVKKLTPQRIVSMGRPAEYRRKRTPVPEHADVADVRSFFSYEGGLM